MSFPGFGGAAPPRSDYYFHPTTSHDIGDFSSDSDSADAPAPVPPTSADNVDDSFLNRMPSRVRGIETTDKMTSGPRQSPRARFDRHGRNTYAGLRPSATSSSYTNAGGQAVPYYPPPLNTHSPPRVPSAHQTTNPFIPWSPSRPSQDIPPIDYTYHNPMKSYPPPPSAYTPYMDQYMSGQMHIAPSTTNDATHEIIKRLEKQLHESHQEKQRCLNEERRRHKEERKKWKQRQAKLERQKQHENEREATNQDIDRRVREEIHKMLPFMPRYATESFSGPMVAAGAPPFGGTRDILRDFMTENGPRERACWPTYNNRGDNLEQNLVNLFELAQRQPNSRGRSGFGDHALSSRQLFESQARPLIDDVLAKVLDEQMTVRRMLDEILTKQNIGDARAIGHDMLGWMGPSTASSRDHGITLEADLESRVPSSTKQSVRSYPSRNVSEIDTLKEKQGSVFRNTEPPLGSAAGASSSDNIPRYPSQYLNEQGGLNNQRPIEPPSFSNKNPLEYEPHGDAPQARDRVRQYTRLKEPMGSFNNTDSEGSDVEERQRLSRRRIYNKQPQFDLYRSESDDEEMIPRRSEARYHFGPESHIAHSRKTSATVSGAPKPRAPSPPTRARMVRNLG